MGLIGSERSAGAAVAQTCSLLYRRFAIGRAPRLASAPGVFGRLQNAILRYSRLIICATSLLVWCSPLRAAPASTNEPAKPEGCLHYTHDVIEDVPLSIHFVRNDLSLRAFDYCTSLSYSIILTMP